MDIIFQPGDILFYTANENSIVDEAIRKVTSSRFVHVAIALNSVTKIEALSSGIKIDALDERKVAASYHFTEVNPKYDKDLFAVAYKWLKSMYGQEYGYSDIVNAVLEKLGIAASIDYINLFDCSALASEFLMKANGSIPNHPEIVDAHKITPGMLANLLEVK